MCRVMLRDGVSLALKCLRNFRCVEMTDCFEVELYKFYFCVLRPRLHDCSLRSVVSYKYPQNFHSSHVHFICMRFFWGTTRKTNSSGFLRSHAHPLCRIIKKSLSKISQFLIHKFLHVSLNTPLMLTLIFTEVERFDVLLRPVIPD